MGLEEIINNVLLDIQTKRDAFIVAQLQRFIPEITLQNVRDYADRVSIHSVIGEPYPERIVLDGTINVCEILEPAFSWDNNSGNLTGSYSQIIIPL